LAEPVTQRGMLVTEADGALGYGNITPANLTHLADTTVHGLTRTQFPLDGE